MTSFSSLFAGKKGAIFDLDGTLIDNMRYHEKAFSEFAKRYGITLGKEDFAWMAGRKNHEIFLRYFGEHTTEELEKMAYEKETLYRKLFEPDIKEIEGLQVFLKKLKELDIHCGIATGAPKENRILIFKHLPIYEYFETVVGSEDVTNGKPHPEVFLTAAKNMGVNPKDCVAFEDAPNGIMSAKKAGMSVVALTTTHTKEELCLADYVISTFEDLL